MSSILILSDDKTFIEQSEKAFPPGNHRITAMSPEAGTFEHFDTSSLDLVFLEDRSDFMTPDHLKAVISRFRSRDIPILMFREPETQAQLPSLLDETVGDCLPLPVDLDEVARRAKLLLKIKRRLHQLRAQAVVDQLTGAYNRRFLSEQLKVRLREAKRHKTPISLILFDLDCFKDVNDTYGHPFGDVVLKGTADLAKRQIREEDILARYGGEEFAVVLPHTDRQGAAVLAERLRKAAAGHLHSNGRGKGRVTISLGVASFPLDEAGSVEDLIESADARLYEAKDSGRNRSVFE